MEFDCISEDAQVIEQRYQRALAAIKQRRQFTLDSLQTSLLGSSLEHADWWVA